MTVVPRLLLASVVVGITFAASVWVLLLLAIRIFGFAPEQGAEHMLGVIRETLLAGAMSVAVGALVGFVFALMRRRMIAMRHAAIVGVVVGVLGVLLSVSRVASGSPYQVAIGLGMWLLLPAILAYLVAALPNKAMERAGHG